MGVSKLGCSRADIPGLAAARRTRQPQAPARLTGASGERQERDIGRSETEAAELHNWQQCIAVGRDGSGTREGRRKREAGKREAEECSGFGGASVLAGRRRRVAPAGILSWPHLGADASAVWPLGSQRRLVTGPKTHAASL